MKRAFIGFLIFCIPSFLAINSTKAATLDTSDDWVADARGKVSVNTENASGEFTSEFFMRLENRWNNDEIGFVRAEAPNGETLSALRTLRLLVNPGASIDPGGFLIVNIFFRYTGLAGFDSFGRPILDIVQVGTAFGVPAVSVVLTPAAFDGDIVEENTAEVDLFVNANGNTGSTSALDGPNTEAPAIAQAAVVRENDGQDAITDPSVTTWDITTQHFVTLDGMEMLLGESEFTRNDSGIINSSSFLNVSGLGMDGSIIPSQEFTVEGMLESQIDLSGRTGEIRLEFRDEMFGFLQTNIEGVIVPESTSNLSLLVLGTLGAASTLKRKLKPSKVTKKELEKVS